MKKILMYLVLILVTFSGNAFSQTKSPETLIKDIDVNGKTYKGKYRIFLSKDGEKWVEVEVKDNKFSVPSNFWSSETLHIEFLLDKHRFIFPDIYIKKFKVGHWRVGIDDNPPFPEKFIPLEEQKNIERLYYISFTTTGVFIYETTN